MFRFQLIFSGLVIILIQLFPSHLCQGLHCYVCEGCYSVTDADKDTKNKCGACIIEATSSYVKRYCNRECLKNPPEVMLWHCCGDKDYCNNQTVSFKLPIMSRIQAMLQMSPAVEASIGANTSITNKTSNEGNTTAGGAITTNSTTGTGTATTNSTTGTGSGTTNSTGSITTNSTTGTGTATTNSTTGTGSASTNSSTSSNSTSGTGPTIGGNSSSSSNVTSKPNVSISTMAPQSRTTTSNASKSYFLSVVQLIGCGWYLLACLHLLGPMTFPA